MFVINVILPTIGQAYNLTGHKWSGTSIYYYYDNYNSSTGKAAFANGASAWSGLDASLSYNASYDVYCLEASYPGADWDGITNLIVRGSNYSSGSVILNTAYTKTWSSAGARKSVAVHEFGHVFGLNENGTTKTIMNAYTWGTNSRYGSYSLTTPQSDDKSGVNSIY